MAKKKEDKPVNDSQILGKLDAILTKMNLRKDWDLLNEQNRRLTGELERVKSSLSEVEMAEKKDLLKQLDEARTVLKCIADMRPRLNDRIYPRDWWIGLECINRAEKYLGRELFVVKAG